MYIISEWFFAGAVFFWAGIRGQWIGYKSIRAVGLVVVLDVAIYQTSSYFVTTGGHSLQRSGMSLAISLELIY